MEWGGGGDTTNTRGYYTLHNAKQTRKPTDCAKARERRRS